MSTDVRKVLAAGAPLPSREPDVAQAWRSGRRRRFRRRSASLAGAAAFLVGATVAIVTVLAPNSTAPSRITATPQEWLTYRDEASGLSISYPASWRPATSTLTPVLYDPKMPLALGTYDLQPQQLGECDIVPQRALEALGPTDAFISVYVYGPVASWGADTERPVHFGPNLPWHHNNIQCTENVRGSVDTLNFADDGAKLEVLVAIGPDASPQRRDEVYRILDTLAVGR